MAFRIAQFSVLLRHLFAVWNDSCAAAVAPSGGYLCWHFIQDRISL